MLIDFGQVSIDLNDKAMGACNDRVKFRGILVPALVAKARSLVEWSPEALRSLDRLRVATMA